MDKNVPQVFYHPGHVFHAIETFNIEISIFFFKKLFVDLEND